MPSSLNYAEQSALSVVAFGPAALAANDGNISVKLDDNHLHHANRGGRLWRPRYDHQSRQTARRSQVDWNRLELKMTDIMKCVGRQFVVHAHPPHATAFAVTGMPIYKLIMPEVITVWDGFGGPYGRLPPRSWRRQSGSFGCHDAVLWRITALGRSALI